MEGGITSLSPITHKEYIMSKSKKTTLHRNLQRAIKNGQLDLFLKNEVFNRDKQLPMISFSRLMERKGVEKYEKLEKLDKIRHWKADKQRQD